MASDTLEKTDLAWQRFQDALGGLSDEQLVEPETMGEWSIKDVMAHLAFWDFETISLIDLYTGVISREEGDEGEPWQQINERVHDERADWPLEQARTEMAASHAGVRARLLEALDAGHTFSDEQLQGNLWNHYGDHTADLLAYRERIAQPVQAAR